MRTVPIGIAMLNDERPHVWEENNPQNVAVVNRWAEIIHNGLRNADGSAPEVIVASQIITSTRVAQQMGEELYQEILAVAAGKLTKSEIYGHHEA